MANGVPRSQSEILGLCCSPEAGYVSHLETIQENSSNDSPKQFIILGFVDGIPFAITNIKCLGGAKKC